MTLSEDVLCDLLLEHGIEGVTLWHIRALAEWLKFPNRLVGGRPEWTTPKQRLESDLRGEEAVLLEAMAYDLDRNWWQSSAHGDGCDCSWCDVVDFQRRVVEGEVLELDAINSEPYDPHYLDQD